MPKLQAVKNIILQPQDYAIALPRRRTTPTFLSVPITNDIDVAVAVRLVGVTHDEFQLLNPQINKFAGSGSRHATGAAAVRQRHACS